MGRFPVKGNVIWIQGDCSALKNVPFECFAGVMRLTGLVYSQSFKSSCLRWQMQIFLASEETDSILRTQIFVSTLSWKENGITTRRQNSHINSVPFHRKEKRYAGTKHSGDLNLWTCNQKLYVHSQMAWH